MGRDAGWIETGDDLFATSSGGGGWQDSWVFSGIYSPSSPFWSICTLSGRFFFYLLVQWVCWDIARLQKVVIQSLTVSDSLWPHGLQQARFPCPSLLPEFAQTHVHWVSDAIQPSYLLPPSVFFAFNLSQLQGLSQWVFTSGGQSIRAIASVTILPIFRVDFL